jgi:amidase
MTIVDKTHLHFAFDRDVPPALTIEPPREVTFETLDACSGRVRTGDQFLHYRAEKRQSGPLTGPVSVAGAELGGTLVVDVLNIELDPSGFQLVGPNRAIVENEVTRWTCYEVRNDDGRILLPNGIELPADPIIGTFGNAPAGRPSQDASRVGGNQDVPAVKVGCRLYIPIEVPGALFSLGDVHARQGDGEVVGAPEIGARVTVRLSVLGHKHSDWLMIEDKTHWHTACSGKDEYQAARRAVFHNADFITKTHNLELKDALILLTMIGGISICRTGAWGGLRPVVCSSFSKELLSKAVANYRKT